MKDKAWHRVTDYLPTAKGRALFLAGIMFVMVGLSNVVTAHELNPALPSYQAYEAQFMLVDGLAFWGWLFTLAGVVAIVAAVVKRYYVGFFSLMLMSMWWAGLFAASLMSTGYTRIIPSIFTWGLISVFLYTISSWAEVVEVPSDQV